MQTNERSWFYVQISTLVSHYDSSFKFQYEACFTGLLAQKDVW